MRCAFLLVLLPLVVATARAAEPKAADYLGDLKQLPALQSEGGPFSVELDPASVTVSTATSFPIVSATFGRWRPEENGIPVCVEAQAVGLQIFDSPSFATVHRMQYENPMMRACFEPVALKAESDANVAIDGFLARHGEGCPIGQLTLIVKVGGRDRWLIMLVAGSPGNLEPEQLRAWLKRAAAKIDFRKLAALPPPSE